MQKFIHAADIHLDSPLLGLEREGAPVQEMRLATRRALENLVSLACDERAGLVVIAGDLYDQEWRDYNTGLFFLKQLAVLREAGIRVVLVSGNHDAASRISRQLRLPDNATLLSDRQAESVVFEELGMAVHGRSYQSHAVTSNLVPDYPPPLPGLFNIGLLHTCADGRPGHETYAPCSLAELRTKGYDYWALGHVHHREVLSTEPWVVFSGNTQGRHANESGSKGVILVTVADGAVVAAEEKAVDVMRWQRAVLDLTDSRGTDDVLDLLGRHISRLSATADGRPLAVRVVFSGTTSLHGSLRQDPDRWLGEARAEVANLGVDVWLERIEVQTIPPIDLGRLASGCDAIGTLFRATRELEGDHERLREMISPVLDLISKLPAACTAGPDAFLLENEDRVLIDRVEQLLLARLSERGVEG